MESAPLDLPGAIDLAGYAKFVALRDSGRIMVSDYPVRPRGRDWRASGVAARFEAIFDRHSANTLATIETMQTSAAATCAIPFTLGACPRTPAWSNGYIPPIDGLSLYAMVAKFRPRVYLEVGSGNSTKFVRRAIEDLGLDTRIVSIDPCPRAEIDALCDQVIRQPMEEVDPAVFTQLDADDMLFIDNAHISYAGSDVTVFFTEVLPALKPGVVYGLHDMALPLDYDHRLVARGYNEHYLMAAYLLGGAAGDEVLFSSAHVAWREDLRATIPYPEHPGMITEGCHGGALWMRKA